MYENVYVLRVSGCEKRERKRVLVGERVRRVHEREGESMRGSDEGGGVRVNTSMCVCEKEFAR